MVVGTLVVAGASVAAGVYPVDGGTLPPPLYEPEVSPGAFGSDVIGCTWSGVGTIGWVGADSAAVGLRAWCFFLVGVVAGAVWGAVEGE